MSTSTSGTKAFVLFASAGSGIVILGCLIGVAVLFNDINSLYDEIMHDMEEFKVYSNDAWRDMVYVQGKVPAGEQPDSTNPSASAFFARIKRQYAENAGVNRYGGSSGGGGGGGCSEFSKLAL